jgi:homoserine dehydrogenase
MAFRFSIVQIGKGMVGAALIDQVAAQREVLSDRLGVDLVYAGIAGRRSGAWDPAGLPLDAWREAVRTGGAIEAGALLRQAGRGLQGPRVLVDVTAEEGMADLYCEAIEAGFHVVSCNKKPVAGPLRDYRRIKEACRRKRRAWLYEVSVGAGLPVIGTLRDLVDSGDRIRSIEGCFSGTLNFLCTSLDRGGKFSEVVARARELGYTEPDPREDLAGMDVARKALILARESGLEIEPEEVRLEPFCAVDRRGDVADFLAKTRGLDDEMGRRWREAAGRGMRLRYVASVDGGCGARLAEVPAEGPLGALAGPENVFSFRSERYRDHPLTVAGPGAGPAVTAAGAFGDILKLARAAAQSG